MRHGPPSLSLHWDLLPSVVLWVLEAEKHDGQEQRLVPRWLGIILCLHLVLVL